MPSFFILLFFCEKFKAIFSEWCHRNTMTCKSGECRGSACDFYPGILEPCNCEVDSETATEEELKQHCHVCCQSVGKPETCKSTGELFQYFKDDSGKNRTIYRQPGSPCDDYKGYCDVFSKCRSVDADGPLAKLKKALFNPVLYSNIKEWIVVSAFISYKFKSEDLKIFRVILTP